MGKRLLRIFEKDFPQKLGMVLGREIHLVLKNNVTLYGKAIEIQELQLIVRDSLKNKHTIPVNRIAEIMLDMESPY